MCAADVGSTPMRGSRTPAAKMVPNTQNAHRDAVEHDEKHVFAGDGVSAAAVPEGPKAVADVGDSGGNYDADDLGGQRFVIEWTSAPSKKENIEQTDVNDECDQADDAKLGNLTEQFLESSP